jgi:type IV pilus assembly protein PilA
MVNKFKTLLKKEKGFTLVELLAVIVILGIIVAIAIPAVGNIIDNAQTEANDAQIELVVDAARLFDVQNTMADGETILVSDLVDYGYLELRDSDTITGGVEKTSSGLEYKGTIESTTATLPTSP